MQLNSRVKDIDDPTHKAPGLNLGSMQPQNPSAQLSLAIGNNQNQAMLAPELKRGGDLE